MKKNLIAFLLAVVMASSSIGAVPALAAETTAPETEAVEETVADGENAAEEAAVEGNTSVDETEVTNEAATDDNDSSESIQEQSEESEPVFPDEEPETAAEDDTEESQDQNDIQPDETEPREEDPEAAPENEPTADQIRAYHEKTKIWKYDNRITIAYDSTEDIRLSYRLYSAKDSILLYEGNLHRIEENGLYYEAVDFDAVNEAENRETNNIDITDLPVKVVIDVSEEQDDENLDSNVYSIEEVVSDETGIVAITEVDTETDGKITWKWDCTSGGKIDGYSVIVRLTERKDSVLVYDTDQLTDNEDEDAYTLDADHQITLNIDEESVSDIAVATYRFDDEIGEKQYGKAGYNDLTDSKENADEEQKDEEVEEKQEAEEVVETESGQAHNDSLYSASEEVASGKCGKDLTWSLDSEGTLTISGTGSMTSYYEYPNPSLGFTVCPWRSYGIKKVIVSSGATDISKNAFSNCTTLESVDLPNSITWIGSQAFYKCSSLTTADIPRSVTYIGENAFNGCSSLTSVMLPEGLSSIESSTFQGCKKLENVEIPDSVTRIKSFAFFNCTGLTSVKIPDGVSSIENGTFSGCWKLDSVTIPYGVSSIGNGAFSDCLSLSSLRIPSSVKSIGTHAFSSCYDLQNIDIPISVTAISIGTFSACTSLESIVIPNSITMIGEQAFAGCTKLANVTIPNSVTRIDSNAFAECENLQSITLPNRMTALSWYTFRMCSNLKSVTIPNSVKEIDEGAFQECNNFEIVYYNGTMSEWESIDIDETNNEPLLNARIVFIDGSSSIKLDSEFTCNLGETITVSATYSSSQDIPVTASVKSDVGAALEFSGFSVLGPFKVNSKYESYISFMVTGKKAGEYNLTLTASDGTTAKTVIKVNPIDISNAEVKLDCPDQYNEGYDCVLHTGSKVEPEILEVKVNGKLLTRNKDYTASYSDNINCGLAKVSLNGIGNYKGQKIAKFYVVPEKVTDLRYADTACGHRENGNIGAAHRALEIEWDAQEGLAGYVIEYYESPKASEASIEVLRADARKFKKENLKRNTEYHVRLTPYIKVDNKTLFGETSNTYIFWTCNHLSIEEFWGFENFTRKVPEQFYRIFFSPAQADRFNRDNGKNGTGGYCFGMAHFAMSILCVDGYPKLEDLAVSSLYDIKSIDQISLVRNGIYLMMTMERFGCYGEKNDVGTFYEWVSQYTSGERSPVTFMVSNGNDGHSLVALDIVEKTKAKAKVLIYDPNYPGEERYLYLYADNNDGNYTRWSYNTGFFVLGKVEGRNGDTTGDYIRLVYENFDNNATYLLQNYYGNGDTPQVQGDFFDQYNNWLMSLQADNSSTDFNRFVINEILENKQATLIENSNESYTDETDGNTRFYWVPKTSDNTIELKGVPAGVKIHIAGNMHSVTVQTDAECDLSICLPETGEGEVQASSDGAVEIQAEFFDFDEDGDKTKTSYSASGNAETPIDIVKNPDDDPDAPLYSGTCGSNLTWSFDESGILRISGTGAMYNYNSSSNRAPWSRTEIRTALKSVIIKNGVTKIGDYAFFSCDKPTSVWIPNSVVSIGQSAFFGCKGLEKVTIPEGVTSLGNSAFNRCSSISTIEISSSVESIGSMAFSNCTSLKDFIVDSDNATYSSIDGTLFNKDQTELICCPAGKKGLYSIPDGVVKIGAFAFSGCSGLTGVAIPDGVSRIDGYAFGDCTGLTSIAIPSSVTYISIEACSNCSKLSKIYFIGTQEEWNSINISSINSILLAVRKIFVDDPKSLSYAEVTKIPNQKYTGRAIKPNFEVQHLCKVLEKGKDYTVSYFDNVNAGTATAKVSGAGEYTGSVSASFIIDPKPISLLEISGISAKTYTGKAQTQAIVVEDGYFTLTKGTDYDVTYANNVKVGTASVVITGKGNYTGTVTKTFTIKKAPNTITAKNFTKTYSTKAQTFSLGVKVKNGTPTYKSSTKYVTVSKSGKVTVKAKYMGKATIKITSPANANYTATTKKITITVNPTKTALVSVTSPSAGKMTVKWKKNTVGIGYQIQYSATSKFTNPKYTTITKNTTLSKTIGSLVKGKKYYVRIRTKKTIGKLKLFSAWSAAKTVTIKK